MSNGSIIVSIVVVIFFGNDWDNDYDNDGRSTTIELRAVCRWIEENGDLLLLVSNGGYVKFPSGARVAGTG